ncbi:family A1 protease [Gloeophyllum trabeum ATCC 11539]|uniref:Family A1 protease n=1 Tax=Gloeophyllum trabeum (strain ATCC 11539 / FP-39264 / Madison 617) TaxID=670483 RepID=S7Q4J6_GLOTA|nr:family A1 protease [Gloeophyllum trabeum ATCC 11539]EPQ54403.1 family A1 protease [Gloeophyllum trabeum ATCC 11539]
MSSPVVVDSSIRFTAHLKGLHAKDILARDQARAHKFLAGLHPHGPAAFHEARRARRHHHAHHHHQDADVAAQTMGAASNSGKSIDVTDAAVEYSTSVGVGTPPAQYDLLIDTGSSNTWLGAKKKYVKTSSSHSTGKKVTVSYGTGSFTGTEYTDTVTLAPNLVIQNQSIGVASSTQDFNDVDGILGIGPVDLTEGTVAGNAPVPTVTDNLYAQGSITTESIGISFEPTTGTNVANGTMTFGGVDSSKYTGEITYVPITRTSPASQYWGIDQDLTYGKSGAKLLSGAPGIVDTGTTLLLIATDAFEAYQKATGATMDQSTGLLTLTESQFTKLQSLYFAIGGTTFELTPNAQIWPRSLNSTIGGEEGKIYLVTSDLGSPSGSGLDFIDGFAFLQRFYSVYDTTNSQVGIANTPWTDATTN